MKITKEQLKQIIKEELEMIMQEEKNIEKDVMEIYRDGIDPQAAAEKLATMYSFRDFENFREYSSKLSYLLFIEGTKNISTKVKPIETPLTSIDGLEIENENVAIAVLRAGLGLVDGVKKLLPR